MDIRLSVVFLIFGVVNCALNDGTRYARENYVRMLREYHNPSLIPLPTTGGPLNVTVTLWLLNILEADVETNQVEMLLLLEKEYVDEHIAWGDVAERLDVLQVPRDMMWPTDLVFENDLGTLSHQPDRADNVEVEHNGRVKIMDKRRVRVPCQLNHLNTRYVAECELRLESSLHSRSFLWLNEPVENTANGLMFSDASKFILTSVSARKETGHYSTGEFETMVTTVNFGKIPDS